MISEKLSEKYLFMCPKSDIDKINSLIINLNQSIIPCDPYIKKLMMIAHTYTEYISAFYPIEQTKLFFKNIPNYTDYKPNLKYVKSYSFNNTLTFLKTSKN
jgi:hypothetical protein